MSRKSPSKQVTITEWEAFYINELLKDRLIQMLREGHADVYIVMEEQKKFEDILVYIRNKNHDK